MMFGFVEGTVDGTMVGMRARRGGIGKVNGL